MENALATTIRKARPADAGGIARIYVASWQDCYPGLLPYPLLRAITEKGQTARWRKILAGDGKGLVLTAELAEQELAGLVHAGQARDDSLGFDGEVFALHIAPDFCGLGLGRALLSAAFAALTAAGMTSGLVWSHARINSRFFWEAMGGRPVAERTVSVMGQKISETAYGWRTLELAERQEAAED